MTPGYWGLSISVTVLLAAIAAVFKFGSWYGVVNSDRKRFNKFIKEIRRDIKDILGRLPPSPTTSASPIRLTDLGERISKSISAKTWAEKIANEIVDETKNMDSLQIQELSFDKAREFEPDEALLK